MCYSLTGCHRTRFVKGVSLEVALDFYLVSVREKRKRAMKMELFSNFNGKGLSAITLMAQALTPLVTGNFKGVPGKSLSVIDMKTDKNGFSGTLKVGIYGTASEVINVNDGSSAFAKQTHHAEKIPHYFRCYVPDNGSIGYLICERKGTSSISGMIRSIFRESIENANSDYILDIRSLSPDYVVSRYINDGTPKSVSFIKHSIPADRASAISKTATQAEGSMEVIYRAKDSNFFRKAEVASSVTKVNGIMDVYAFDDFQPDEVKMTVDVGGKLRTLSLQNKRNMRSSFDITDDVGFDADGMPIFADIDAQAVNLIKEMAKTTGIHI